GVADAEHLDEIFLDLAKKLAAARNDAAGAARAHQPHFEHVSFDNGPDIEAIALRHARIGDAPASVLALADLGEALIGLERIAAAGYEIDGGIEISTRQVAVGRRSAHLREQLVAEERLAAGAPEHVLRQHIERASPQGRRVLRILGD